jgi:hypothetical protein
MAMLFPAARDRFSYTKGFVSVMKELVIYESRPCDNGQLGEGTEPSYNRITVQGLVEFWDSNDRTWNRSVMSAPALLGDLLDSGAWVRRLMPEDIERLELGDKV